MQEQKRRMLQLVVPFAAYFTFGCYRLLVLPLATAIACTTPMMRGEAMVWMYTSWRPQRLQINWAFEIISLQLLLAIVMESNSPQLVPLRS